MADVSEEFPSAFIATEETIANEFAIAVVRKIHTRNGVRLEIEAPKRGFTIQLDPVALESLACWQSSRSFNDFIVDVYYETMSRLMSDAADSDNHETARIQGATGTGND